VKQGSTLMMAPHRDWWSAWAWTGYGTLLGIALGLLFVLLLHRVRERSHHLLLCVGLLIFSGGLGAALGVPPLFLSFVAGVVLVNATGHHPLTWEIAVASERPFYFILLILVGAGWHAGSQWALLLAPMYFLARVAAKSFSLWAAGRLFLGRNVLDARSGLALSGQGATALALAASVQMLERGTLADSVLTMILTAAMLTSLFAPSLTRLGLSRGATR